MDYIAHLTEDKRVQKLVDHCENTAKLTGSFAAVFDEEKIGYQTGLLHDIGKYSREFQDYIRGNGSSPDHSTAGCQECKRNMFSAFCIAGHHAGLPDLGTPGDTSSTPTLQGRVKKKVKDYQAFREEISVQLAALNPPPKNAMGKVGFDACFFTRMLYSCLVDADFLDTEAFMKSEAPERGHFDSLETLWEKLQKKIAQFDPTSSELNHKRCDILSQCQTAAQWKPGVFTLTVPTGGGKTISSMTFAMEHARKYDKQRIIYVIPYTSIIEQTADVFREIFGAENVLEHHASVNYQESLQREGNIDKMKLAAENWDAPIIITTNVQFFESLFANRSSKCRKLHNIANSVVIFDEAQMLPVPYLKPCVQAIAELAENYRVSAVLCTATQPALDTYFPAEISIREMIPNAAELYESFRRVTIQVDGNTEVDALAQTLMEHEEVLCIVNSRRKAQNLFSLCEADETYHLSTLMAPKHRRAVLQEVKRRLKKSLPCKLIATTVVEAGVDVDFPSVYREQSGLDSVLQAAGRCNREGKRSAQESIVHMFALPGALPAIMQQAAGMMRETIREAEKRQFDIGSPESVRYYFDQLHRLKEDELDTKQIMKHSERMAFAEIAKQFKLIENDTRSVFVPLDEEAEQMAERLKNGEYSRDLLRKAAPYIVSIYPNHFEALAGVGALTQLSDDLAILEDMSKYNDKTGLELDIETGIGLFC